ncbi:acetylornithine carbamoyltransferase [Tenacibaculum sp. L6]|uniref:acetylornithine carbamoyltransferase n=1 Tax=Tenacibaculum sp. L6 TaxID=2992764 RepID=UPI00237A3569|nr:acetylornithine carbamoyltransferase [Tenacibaculum sp. L6]MDE0535224.1 acetylornithine carbamoyltransferase [Tenacibaculum sp. L6]
MKKYTTINDIENLSDTIQKAIQLKKNPYQFTYLGQHKTLVMLFFNASLRTRLSTEKAAKNLGMQVSVLNVNNAWNMEFEDGTAMNLNTSEHIKEAAKVISQYADIIAVRAFPTLENKKKDRAETVLNSFVKYATVPIVNMESATDHPLQSLADAITITETKKVDKPKVVLSWAPHPKALPHSVANAFVHLMHNMDVEFVITHPKGYELDPEITQQFPIEYDQEKAFENADFIYAKNWSSFNEYGKILNEAPNWMITQEKIGTAKFMHCLPIRRNMVAEDAVLDGENSLVIEQANNRTFAAQVVLQQILGEL